jgi:hypothetical protein
MDLGNIGLCRMDWIDLAHDRDKLKTIVITAMNIWVS